MHQSSGDRIRAKESLSRPSLSVCIQRPSGIVTTPRVPGLTRSLHIFSSHRYRVLSPARSGTFDYLPFCHTNNIYRAMLGDLPAYFHPRFCGVIECASRSSCKPSPILRPSDKTSLSPKPFTLRPPINLTHHPSNHVYFHPTLSTSQYLTRPSVRLLPFSPPKFLTRPSLFPPPPPPSHKKDPCVDGIVPSQP